MSAPLPSAPQAALADGVVALPQGLLWLERARTLVAADAHLAYEEVVGGALPLWSTAECVQTLRIAARRIGAHEIVVLGDVIHASHMSAGAARTVAEALASLRSEAEVTLVAGNHEGRSRGADVLGVTHEAIERDGWTLAHGDEVLATARAIVGHLHPSIPLGAGTYVPAFLAGARLIVVPALTPYSTGLNVLTQAGTAALRAFVPSPDDLVVVASDRDRVYPFGALGALRAALRGGAPVARRSRRRLRPDAI